MGSISAGLCAAMRGITLHHRAHQPEKVPDAKRNYRRSRIHLNLLPIMEAVTSKLVSLSNPTHPPRSKQAMSPALVCIEN